MKQDQIAQRKNIIPIIEDEIRQTENSRYYHRLHGILLVARGLSCRQTAGLLGDAPRTISYWVRRFQEEGLSGLAEAERPGRPRKLSQPQLEELSRALQENPMDLGLQVDSWDGKALSTYVANQWGVSLGVRQSQRILRQFGPRFRRTTTRVARSHS